MTVVFLKLQIKNTQIGRNFCAKHTVFLLYMKLCVLRYACFQRILMEKREMSRKLVFQ